MTPQQLFEHISTILQDTFQIEAENITLQARLGEDLDIDSIDAVDLIDYIRRKTGKKLAAEDFKAVRTVGDVVAAVHRMTLA